MRDAWLEADALGVDAIFTYDHFFPAEGDADGPVFEGWTTLAALAQVTSSAEVGCLVAANSFRNPNLLADMARTIDHISGGRLILGIGSGWVEKDYFEYGYDFGTPVSRLQDLVTNVPIIKDRLTRLNPPPVDGTLPILIGGGGEKVTLKLVAEHADIWHFFGSLEDGIRKSAVLEEWMAKLGRDPRSIERAINLFESNFSNIESYVSAGFTHFTIVSSGPEWNLEFLKQAVGWRNNRA